MSEATAIGLAKLIGEVSHLRDDFEGFATRMEKVVAEGPIDIQRVKLSLVTAILVVFMLLVNIIGPAIFYFTVTKTEFIAIKTEFSMMKTTLSKITKHLEVHKK